MLTMHKTIYKTNVNEVNLKNWSYLGTNNANVSFYAGLVPDNQVQIIVLDNHKIQFFPRYFVDTLINADTTNGMELEGYIPSWTLSSKQFTKLQDLLQESVN